MKNKSYKLTMAVLGCFLLSSPTYAVTADDVVCSGCVNTADIAPNAINSGRIGNREVKNADLDQNAVTSVKIMNGEVKTIDLAEGAANSKVIRDGDIQTIDLADGAVTGSKLAPSVVQVPNGTNSGDQLSWNTVNNVWVAQRAIGTFVPARDNMQPWLGVNYIIALVGTFPSRNSLTDSTIAEISLFGGNFAPRGWAFADGQLLPISQYTALFSILGTTYGGDGRTTFALPDLRGRVAVHPGSGAGLTPRRLGARGGTETIPSITIGSPVPQ